MDIVLIDRILWVALLIAQGILVVRLIHEALARTFPFFVVYIASELASGLILVQIPFQTRAYTDAFMIYAVVNATLKIAVAGELWIRIWTQLPGIERARFWLSGSALLSSALVAIVLMSGIAAEWKYPQTWITVMRKFENEILCVALLMLWLFFSRVIDVRPYLTANLRTHWKLATGYFAAAGINAFLILFLGRGPSTYFLNAGMMSAQLCCLVFWLRMNRANELVHDCRFNARELAAFESREREMADFLRSLRD